MHLKSNFTDLILSRNIWFYLGLVLVSITSGLLNSGLLVFINSTINESPIPIFPEYDWLIFALLIVFSFLVNRGFQSYMIKLTTNMNFDFEILMLRKLKDSSYSDFLLLGEEKVFTAIEDLRVLGNLPEVFLNAVNSCMMLLCCFFYMFYISFTGGIFILLTMIGLFIFYLQRNKIIEKDLYKIRNLQDDYYRILKDMLEGFKELKMNKNRRETLFKSFILNNRKKTKSLTLNTNIKYLTNQLTGNFSWHIVFGVIMFLLSRLFALDPKEVSSFIVTILYLIGPIAVLVTLIPITSRVKISLQRLHNFEAILNTTPENQFQDQHEEEFPVFKSLRFENVVFEYCDKENANPFVFGPVNFKLLNNEIVFVTGGNGSGKSTLVYLLTFLYKPLKGKIFYNDHEIDLHNFEEYRSRISVIFTQNYLFHQNYDLFDFSNQNKRFQNLIEMMHLDKKLNIDKENNTIGIQLSKGQKKRLAMIYAILEDRPLLILDEWAAEQDPEFRAYFYTHLLPLLRSEGKTVIAITHDDAYFHLADRVIKFDMGRIRCIKHNCKALDQKSI